MKTSIASFSYLLLALCGLWPAEMSAKGGGVGFWMEGTVTEVKTAGDKIHFTLKGRFWFDQYGANAASPPIPQRIEVDCRKGISVTVHQHDPFFAFTTNWRGGALREKGELLRILNLAEKLNRNVKFELLEPAIIFGPNQTITLTDAAVIRATDADLR